jgi:hypothetical protein
MMTQHELLVFILVLDGLMLLFLGFSVWLMRQARRIFRRAEAIRQEADATSAATEKILREVRAKFPTQPTKEKM